MQTIGQLIKEYRKEKELTQGELAQLISTSDKNISKYEKGIVVNIPLEKLCKLVETLGIPYYKLPAKYAEQLSILSIGIKPDKTINPDQIQTDLIHVYGDNVEFLVSTDYTPQCWQIIKSYAKGVQETMKYLIEQERSKAEPPAPEPKPKETKQI